MDWGMDPNDQDKLFSSNDDNIKVNARKSPLTRKPPSGKRRKNGGVLPIDLSITVNAVINVKSQVATLRTV